MTRSPNRWYGLGFILETVGGRTLVGHSGGFPGHITQSWLDPETGLAVSVLTNCLGGPATEWATNLVRLIDLTVNPPARKDADAPDVDLDSFTGRFATDWGAYDVVNLNGRLVSLAPQGDPGMSVTELTVVDADTLAPAPDVGLRRGRGGLPLRARHLRPHRMGPAGRRSGLAHRGVPRTGGPRSAGLIRL